MHLIEKFFTYKGLKCVVMLNSGGHRCGYVGVSPQHPLYGVDYTDNLNIHAILEELKNSPIGKRGSIPVFFWDGESTRLDVLVDVHGGITYSAASRNSNYPITQIDPLWWFGFDCAHYGDARDWEAFRKLIPSKAEILYSIEKKYGFDNSGIVRTTEYVEQECKNLADQLQYIATFM